jgi:hypothetical protein
LHDLCELLIGNGRDLNVKHWNLKVKEKHEIQVRTLNGQIEDTRNENQKSKRNARNQTSIQHPKLKKHKH